MVEGENSRFARYFIQERKWKSILLVLFWLCPLVLCTLIAWLTLLLAVDAWLCVRLVATTAIAQQIVFNLNLTSLGWQ
jgi:hypothetical protein